MMIGEKVLVYREDILHHVRELIRIRSVLSEPKEGMPYGEGVHAALTYVLQLAEQLGFRTAQVDGHAGHAEYGEGEKLAAVLVHVDTVAEGDGWSVDPFQAVLRDGRIYGRGASDNKAAAIAALFCLKAVQDSGLLPKKRIRIIFGTNEENGMTDLDHYFEKEPLPDYGFTPDAAYPIIHAEKGYYVIRLSVKHPSSPVTLTGERLPTWCPTAAKPISTVKPWGRSLWSLSFNKRRPPKGSSASSRRTGSG
ncbi:Sapep family Mn(2+)-dependent dipeptidase [Paenibacillus sp. CC-CFT747]|nr:Sapep family Mn(2+)-dependent dipeptidase [Paenibacillus sp. CC-CFT747]